MHMNNEKIIKRVFDGEIEKTLSSQLISVILGPRRVGKSTSLGYLIPKDAPVLHLNFDSRELREKVLERESFVLEQIESITGSPLSKSTQKFYLVVDEAQKLPESFEIIKQLHEQYRSILKIILSGSSSLLIKKRVSETLAGRAQILKVAPFLIEEAMLFADKKSSYDCLKLFQSMIEGRWTPKDIEEKVTAKRYLKNYFSDRFAEFVTFGMLPPRFHLPDASRWHLFLRDYIDLYIDKDMQAVERIGSLGDYRKVVQFIGNNVGNLINYSNIANACGIHRQTVKEYLQILVESLVGFKLPAFTLSTERRISKSEKCYLFDNGLAYYFMGLPTTEVLQASGRIGALYENFIVAEMKKYADISQLPVSLAYWRLAGSNPPEADLVFNNRGIVVPVEIKMAAAIVEKQIRGINHFVDSFGKRKDINMPYSIVIYRGDHFYSPKNRTYFIPDWLWA